LKIDLKWGVI